MHSKCSATTTWCIIDTDHYEDYFLLKLRKLLVITVQFHCRFLGQAGKTDSLGPSS